MIVLYIPESKYFVYRFDNYIHTNSKDNIPLETLYNNVHYEISMTEANVRNVSLIKLARCAIL